MAKKDLVPMSSRTKEEQHRIAVMGGIASGEARRNKRDLRKIVDQIFEMQVTNAEKKELKKMGINDEDLTNAVYIVMAQLKKAKAGDTRAFEVLRDTSGQNLGLGEERTTPTINLNIVDNSNLEKVFYEKGGEDK